MEPFIVFIGPNAEITYARDLADAEAKARRFAMAEGLSAEEANDPEEVYARPYDHFLARDHGLTWLDATERGWEVAEARP